MALLRNNHFELIPPCLDFSNHTTLRTRYRLIRNALPAENRADFGVRILEYVQLEHLSNFQFSAKKCAKDDWEPFFAFWKANGPHTATGNAPNWTTSHVVATRLSHLRKDHIFKSGSMVFFDLLWNYIGRLGLDYLQNHQHGPGLSAARARFETNQIVAYWQRNCGKVLRKAADVALRAAQSASTQAQPVPTQAQSAPTQVQSVPAQNDNAVSQSIPAPIPPLNNQRNRKTTIAPNPQPDAQPPRKLVKLNIGRSDQLSSKVNTQDHTVEASSSAVRTRLSATDTSCSTSEAFSSVDVGLYENDPYPSSKKTTSSGKKAVSSRQKPSSSNVKEPSTEDNKSASSEEVSSSHREFSAPNEGPPHSSSLALPSFKYSSSPSSSSSSSSSNESNDETPLAAPTRPPPIDAAPLPWDTAGLLVFNALNFAHHFASTAANTVTHRDKLIDKLTGYFSLPAEEQARGRNKVLQELTMWKTYRKIEMESIEADERFMIATAVGKLKDEDASSATIVSVEELQDAIAREWLKRNVEEIDDDDGEGVQVDEQGDKHGDEQVDEREGVQVDKQVNEQGDVEDSGEQRSVQA